ncbi:MAG: cupin domain-containing protein, partial [Candidatus Tectomicrobia bacterium]|nr:cupin domain-containing protein [Candidatus Tectomicrobia bacterium]
VFTQEDLVRELPSLLRNTPGREKDSPGQGVEVLELENLRNKLERLSRELARRVCFRGERYESGLISFQPQPEPDPKQIVHTDKDVVCHVLSGQGRLRLNRAEKTEMILLKAGTVVRISSGIAHDFAASGPEELMIWYLLITTTSPR